MDSKPWLNQYPESVPKYIKQNSSTLIDLIEDSFKKYSNLPMLENMSKIVKYKDIDRLSKNFAAYIQNCTSLVPNDHVALQLPNILQYPVAALGFIRAGMVLVNLNPLYTPYEMKFQIKDSQAKAIVILENIAYKLESILPELNIKNVFVTKMGDLLGFIKGNVVNFTLKYLKNNSPNYNISDKVMFKDMLKKGSKLRFNHYKAKSDDTLLLQYTGGTTGVAKGAMLSHSNIVANLDQIQAWFNMKIQEGKETTLTALPLYHIYSLTINFFIALKIGAKNILLTNPRNVKNFIKNFKKSKLTYFSGVNTLFHSLLSQTKFQKLNFSKIKFVVAGGMSLSEKVAKQWEKITGIPLIETYGLTETSPAAIGNPFNGKHKSGTIGLPIPNTDVRIVDDNDNLVECDQAGNLQIKGPQVMKGYWSNPEETKLILKNEWLSTGDIASIDEAGYVKILDRKKDVIFVSGFNVYSIEIENIVYMLEDVCLVAAIGVPYDELRETIKLFVVKNKDSNLTQNEIITHCKKYLTSYKIPKVVEFRDSLPVSHVGKVLKRLLI